ncbi:hypothetical protein F7P83_01740 [Brevibacterium luteolum]|nr:hypothetical protein [Brevibacterium luteolum]
MGRLNYAMQLAEHLQTDPLHIAPAVAVDVPSTTRQALEDELAAQPDNGIPVYVVITEPGHADANLGTLTHEALGGHDSVILVLAPHEGIVRQTVNVPTELGLEYHQRIAAGEAGHAGDPPPTEAISILAQLRDESFEVQQGHEAGVEQPAPAPRTEVIDPGAGLAAALVLVPVALAAAAVTAGVVLRRRRQRKARYQLPKEMLAHARALQAERLRGDLSADSLRIAARLEELDTQDLDAAHARQVEHGLDAYALAGRIVDDPAAGAVDLAGALVLLSIAARDLDAVERSAPQTQVPARQRRGRAAVPERAEPRKLCAFDPTHGESTGEVRETGRAGGARVPACGACAAGVEAGRPPDWLYDGATPYAEADTVWARTLFGAVGDDLVTQLQRATPGSQRG